MVAKYYDYSALSVGATFTTSDTTKASAIGATTTVISNGVLTISSDAPTGLTNSIEGTTQSVSGTTYISESITATGTISVSVYWKMPTSVGSIGSGLLWLGNAGTLQMTMSLLSTEQLRFFDASNATLFTTTFAGGFVAAQWYRTDFHVTQGTSTTGRLVAATYTEHGTSALTNTSYDSGATVNMGTLTINRVRHGTRSTTSTADENVRVRVGYDPASAYLMGPQSTGATVAAVTATATAQAGTPTVSGVRHATVLALTATATALAEPPAVSSEVVIASSGPATATALASPPAVTGGAVVTAVRATSTAAAGVPTVAGGAAVIAVRATATAAAGTPLVEATGTGTVIAVRATATAAAAAPAVTGGALVTAVTATASAAATAPAVGVSVTVVAVRATGTAAAYGPVVSGGADVTVVKAAASAVAYAPSATGGAVLTVVVSTATTAAWAPVVIGRGLLDPPVERFASVGPGFTPRVMSITED